VTAMIATNSIRVRYSVAATALAFAAALTVGSSPSQATGDSSPAAAHTCRGHVATIVGSLRADEIHGTPNRDIIVGLAGNDDIEGRGGNDLICGNRGADELEGERGNDHLIGGLGFDEAEGGLGADVCSAERTQSC
jgi:Ca2+-binding RTX toxin-like protein